MDRERASHLLGTLWSINARYSPANLLLLCWPNSFFGVMENLEVPLLWSSWGNAAAFPAGVHSTTEPSQFSPSIYLDGWTVPNLISGSTYSSIYSLKRIRVSVLVWFGCFAVDLRMYSQHSNSWEDLSSFSKFSVPNGISPLQPLWMFY